MKGARRKDILREGARKPCDMKTYMGIIGVILMTVTQPTPRIYMELDVAFHLSKVWADSQYGTQEVRPRFKIPNARLLNANLFAVLRVKECWTKTRVEPDALDVAF